MEFKYTNDYNLIQHILDSCSDSFYNQEINDKKIINNLAYKFSRNAEFLYCLENKKILGFVAFYCNNADTRLAYLSMIIVNNEFQNQGVGKSLIYKVINLMEEKGFEKLKLEVANSNKNAISFYKKLGFEYLSPADKMSSYYILNIRN